jgi:hypothetical protein
LGVQLVVIQEKVDGLGNFHAPPPVFDGIMLMLIDREYHNFLRKSDKFLAWQAAIHPFLLLSPFFLIPDPFPCLAVVCPCGFGFSAIASFPWVLAWGP